MGMYMYPIPIKRKAQKVNYTDIHYLDDSGLSIKELRKYMIDEDEKFYFDSDENRIIIYRERLETPSELASRVQKEEDYMRRYEEWHKNNPKPKK